MSIEFRHSELRRRGNTEQSKKQTNKYFCWCLSMSKGISNLQIENALRNIGDEELDDNFVGVFASDRMNRFINHAEKRKISFLYC